MRTLPEEVAVVFQHFSRLFTSPLLIVVDDTIERRSGKKIKAKGCYRDACRSTEAVVVTCFGLKWVCFMLIVPLPWCQRPWALPFMTILAPSKKSNEARGRRHKTSIDWTIIAVRVISRWLKRSFVLIGDGGFACIRLGHACKKQNVVLVSRLRLDAALYDLPPSPIKGQLGRHREKGARVTTLKVLVAEMSQAWQETEVTWYGNEKKSVRVLSGINLMKNQTLPILSTAWYNKKSDATFSDIMAYVRRSIWAKKYFNDSRFEGEYVIIKRRSGRPC